MPLFRKAITAGTALTLALASTACSHQQKPAPVAETQAPAETVELGAPALWKVADEDTTIYLFGTVHLLPEDVVWYKGDLARALESSDALVTEINMKAADEAQAMQTSMAKGMLPAGQTLRSLLNEEQKAQYEAALATTGIPAVAFDRMKPWMAAVNLSMMPLLAAGYSPESGVEKVLEEKAAGKERGALETVGQQLDVFDSLPQESQIRFLMETANSMDKIVPILDDMVDVWVRGEPERLAKMMNESFSDPAMAKALLYDRNANWAEWIDTRMDQPGTVFIAVGAGHLAGEQSVQDLLAKRDIAVTRVQ